MKNLALSLGLKREAMLLDSKLYIIKSTAAIATGYLVGINTPIANIDMISVLLGVMYNLEAINVSGVKGGISQLIASTIGAACTGILIFFFGINVFTIALAMALTLYVSLKINWRMVSPVAIFTCIYMTQFIQLSAAGEPSILLTFRLRIIALSLGVSIAILYNFLFSFIYYKKIAYKRLEFVKLQSLRGLKYTKDLLEGKESYEGNKYSNIYSSIFNDIELVTSNINTMLKESDFPYKSVEKDKLSKMLEIIQLLKGINHLSYDTSYAKYEHFSTEDIRPQTLILINKVLEELEKIDFTKVNSNLSDKIEILEMENLKEDRIAWNLISMTKYMNQILEKMPSLY